MASRLDPDALFARGFKAGSIVRLKMKNFLTYDECEFFTGPRLNIVIGPNGTGKSALTHAICLACCGSTGDVGRSNDLSKFVKHGAEKQESYAEVDILTQDRLIATIRREINSENKGSKWYLNGKVAKQADVKALVSGLSIDVDNLCSFMPQDKVGSFSRFTPKEILSNTLRSIQDPGAEYSLSEEQQQLSQIQDAKEEYRRKRDAKQASLVVRRAEQDSMRGEMDRMERREERKKLLADYEVRLMAVEIGELTRKVDDKQAVVDEKTARLQEERRRVAPLEEQERDLRKQQAGREKAAEDAVAMQRKIDDSLRAKKDLLAQRDQDAEEEGNKLILLARTRATREVARDNAQAQLLAAQVKEADTLKLMPGIHRNCQAAREAVDQLTAMKSDMDEEVSQLSQRCEQLRDEVAVVKKDLDGLHDFKQMYKHRMSKHGDPTVRQAMLALDWLDNNRERLRQTGQLRGEVYGPVAMHCSVADPACAAMLEKAIPMNKLMGFVAENDHDAMFLKNELRENRKIFVDIYTMKNIRINDPREYPDSLVAELGLKGYLCDQLDCPDIIRGLFYSFHNLQKVLWGRRADNLTSEHQTRLINQAGGFRLYLHDAGSSGGSSGGRQQRSNIVEYRGTVSRNAHMPPSTSSIGVTARGVLLSKGGDEDSAQRREELQRDLREAETKLRQAEKQMQEQQGKAREVAGKLHAKRGEMAELIRASKQPEQMRKDVLALQKKLSDLNQQLSVGADREKGAQVELYKNAIQSFLQAVSDTAAVAEKSNAHRVDREVAAALRDELLTALNDLSATLQDAKRGIKDLSKELAQAERERDDAARRQAEKETILEAQIASFGMSPEQFARDVYVAIEARCPETTVAELMVRIDQLNEDINKTADNPDLQRRYEDVTKEVTRLEQELQQASQEFENAQESMDKRAKKWEDMVGKITEKLNVKFETYMNDLQLGGKVKLKRVGNYNDYELQLMVRFRDNTDFSELDGNKHSGGERAVSTVMFLMALQDMTTSPFRVVDEINQGMDESNERLVFDRVVKSCCGDASKPQYFLVTPKLLQGLGAMRNDDVTILLVWNGPGAESKWEFTEILEDLSQGHVRRARPAASTAAPQRGMRVVKPEPGAAGSKRARQEVTEDEDEEGGASRGGKAGGQRGSTAKLVEVKKQKG